MDREQLERELVRKDKQAVITDCLKIYDTNNKLLKEFADLQKEWLAQKEELKGKRAEIKRLRARKWYSILNTHIAQKLEAKRRRNEQYKKK